MCTLIEFVSEFPKEFLYGFIVDFALDEKTKYPKKNIQGCMWKTSASPSAFTL